MTTDQYVNHEVRMQLVENSILRMEEGFKELRKENSSHFKWVIGSILGTYVILLSILTPIAIHAMKLG